MEIKAKCKFDKVNIRALAHLSSYKRFNPKKTVMARTGLCLILLLLLIAELTVSGFNIIPMILIIADILVIIIDCFVYFILPEIQYRSLAKMKDTENNYIFTENTLKIQTKSEVHSGESEIEYAMIQKVYETSGYFFIYITGNQVFIVDKSTVEGGSHDDIRNKLGDYLKDKYIICKY